MRTSTRYAPSPIRRRLATAVLPLAAAALVAGCNGSAGGRTDGYDTSPGGSPSPTAAATAATAEQPTASPSVEAPTASAESTPAETTAGRSPGPPDATPLAEAPAEPAGDGTTATISTELGDVTIELYTDSAPVAAANFINLADSGFYEGVVFHRIVPDFMIQGGDPEGTGTGGPGYTIPDEPYAGQYTRGTVAMARTAAPNSQGSQFFIVVADSPFLEGGGYTIFGNVTSGMEVVDEIVSGPRGGPQDDQAEQPVQMTGVTIQRP
ncbi:hypothetical protein BH20CHL6_BH20CHL6_00870 [soil metagenome]